MNSLDNKKFKSNLVNKKYIGIIILLIWCICIYFFWLSKNNDLNNKDIYIDYKVINKSWDTDYQDKVYYKKWDEIEYRFIIKNFWDDLQKILVNINELTSKLNLDKIKVDTSSDKIWKWEASVIKISWIANDSWIADEHKAQGVEIDMQKDLQKEPEKQGQKKDLQEDLTDKDIIVEIDGDNFIWNIDNLIKLNGKGFWYVKSIWIGERFFDVIKNDAGYYINVQADLIKEWTYFTSVVKKDGNMIPLTQSVSFEYNDQPVIITNIMPNSLKNDIPRWLTIQWKWLKGTISVQLSNNEIFKKTDFNPISDKILLVKIPYNMSVWKYYVNIMTVSWIYEFPEFKFEVVGVE